MWSQQQSKINQKAISSDCTTTDLESIVVFRNLVSLSKPHSVTQWPVVATGSTLTYLRVHTSTQRPLHVMSFIHVSTESKKCWGEALGTRLSQNRVKDVESNSSV